MSSSEQKGWRDSLADLVRGKGPQQQSQYARLGAKAVIPPFFSIRQEILLRQKFVINDRSLDIADRVDEADTLLSVIGLPFSRGANGGNPGWTFGWNSYQDYAPGWQRRVARRLWYRTERLAKVRDWVETPEYDEQSDGTVLITTKQVPIVRMVREDTWAQRQALDATMVESKKGDPQWKDKDYKGIEFINWVQQKDTTMLDLLDELGYDTTVKERALLIEGEELIAAIMDVLNLAWLDKDTPSASGDVFFMTQGQQQQQRYGIEGTAGIGKPPAQGRTGVHQA
jgi:hypothetical protein